MIDIHAHIIWGVDDGPATKQESEELIKYAVKEGIEVIVATSHALHPHYHAQVGEVQEKVKELNEWIDAHQLPIRVLEGHEVRLGENVVSQLLTGDVLALHDTRYILVEFPSSQVPLASVGVIKELIRQDYIPIIAHPERNKVFAKRPQKLVDLLDLGAVCQVTAGSAAGMFGKSIQKMTVEWANKGYIQLYGSDVHDKKVRAFSYDKGLSYLEKKCGIDLVEFLLENNDRVINDLPLLKIESKDTFISKVSKILTRK